MTTMAEARKRTILELAARLPRDVAYWNGDDLARARQILTTANAYGYIGLADRMLKALKDYRVCACHFESRVGA